jgi:hypothetical protein
VHVVNGVGGGLDARRGIADDRPCHGPVSNLAEIARRKSTTPITVDVGVGS